MSRVGFSSGKINGEELGADIEDGEVIGWKPITMEMLNSDIETCITYLNDIRVAIKQSKGR